MDKTFKTVIGIFVIIAFILLIFLSNINFSMEKEVVNNDTNFIVGFDETIVPFSYLKNGEYTGFDLELAEEVAKRNNWTFVKKPIAWSEKKEIIDSGEIDCVWGSFTIEGRESDYEWSDPYLENKVVVLVKSDSGINSISDLKGKKVEYIESCPTETKLATVNKTLGDSFLSKNAITTYGIGVTDIYSGGTDAMFADLAIANYYVSHSGGQLKILNDVFSYEHYGVGFKKGNTELRDKVQATLNEMAADGTIDRIAQKYNDYGINEAICI